MRAFLMADILRPLASADLVSLQALMGGADDSIPPDQVEELRQALQKAGVEHDIVTYPGAPHSFFDRTYEQHKEASADAWRRVVDFVRKHQE